MQTLQILLCAVSSLLFVFLSSVQIPFDGCPEIHMHHPSHLRIKPQPLETTRPIANYHTRKKEERRKKIHNAETHIRSFSKLIACFVSVSACNYISNTEHVHCACNDYKLQELTFKCLNLFFVRVIRTLKEGIEGLQILF